jgi:uncharacterized protein YbbK (DUF523 family)
MEKSAQPMMQERPQLGISACLMGERVRYDGGHKALDYANAVLDKHFDLVRICPEVAIGLGIPRPALQLHEDNDRLHVRGVDDPMWDVTDDLVRYGEEVSHQHANLAGYLFKSRSPSCGLHAVPVHRADGTVTETGRGGFAQALLQRVHDLPAIQEDQLADAATRESFFIRVYARYRFQQCRTPEARRHYHHYYTLASQARGKSEAQPVSLLDKRPRAYLSELLSRLQAPVVRSAEAAIMRELCERDAPRQPVPIELQRYVEGDLPRHRAVSAVQDVLVDPGRADWFLHPFPQSLEET